MPLATLLHVSCCLILLLLPGLLSKSSRCPTLQHPLDWLASLERLAEPKLLAAGEKGESGKSRAAGLRGVSMGMPVGAAAQVLATLRACSAHQYLEVVAAQEHASAHPLSTKMANVK